MRKFIPFGRNYNTPPPPPPTMLRSYLVKNTALSDKGGYYFASDYAKIYNFPSPPTKPIVIGVISLGGSLYGTYNPTTRTITNGDVQLYWQLCNIMPAMHPKVLMVQLPGSNTTVTSTDTQENTMDVATIGACCPGSNVTIIMYVAPNTIAGFAAAFNAAINGVSINGTLVKSNIISCSWGAPESNYRTSDIITMNTIFQKATTLGIPICAASGDLGASNGLPGNNADFPASSPHVIACGGTTLNCPNLVYDSSTNETAWSYTPTNGGGGGGYSKLFTMPDWQNAIKANQPVLNAASNRRAVPDIAMNANPRTGTKILIGCSLYVCGGTSIVAPAMAALIGCMDIPAFTAANLYTSSALTTYRDITVGNIGGGFAAGLKYDCATGLGTPNGKLLQTAAR